jgi:hypothetical protein
MSEDRYFILRIDSFEGRDTHISCGDDRRDYLYIVGSLDEQGNAEVMDCGYRNFEEAAQAWPEARPASEPPDTTGKHKTKRRGR